MKQNQHGSALVMALFALALLTGMGTALLFLSQHETRMSKAGLRAKRSFFLAESAVENGRMTLWADNGITPDFDDDLLAAAGDDGEIDFDPTQLSPVYVDGNLTGFTGYDDDEPLRDLTGLNSVDGQGWYMAFLTNDPVEGPTTLNDGNQRLMITAVGAGEDRSLELVQAIIEPYRVLPPVPPAAIAMLGPQPAFFDNGNSNAQDHTGDDCGVPGGAFAPIVGTVSSASKNQVQNDMNQPDNFESGPFTGQDTVGDLTDLSDPIVDQAGNGIIDPAWVDCPQIKAMVEGLQVAADYYCNTDTTSCTFPSTPDPDTIVFIDGDLSSTPSGSYQGVLVVTGELVYNGNTGWDGIVLVVGEGRVIRSGGGTGNPTGGLIIAAIDPTPSGPAADKSDWCTSPPDGFLQSFYDTSGGGDSTVQWCTALLNSANPPKTYKVEDFLQR